MQIILKCIRPKNCIITLMHILNLIVSSLIVAYPYWSFGLLRWSILAEITQRLTLHLITASMLLFRINFILHWLWKLKFFFPDLLLICVILSSIIRHIPLDSIDPSLAIGFYCRDKGLLFHPLFSLISNLRLTFQQELIIFLLAAEQMISMNFVRWHPSWQMTRTVRHCLLWVKPVNCWSKSATALRMKVMELKVMIPLVWCPWMMQRALHRKMSGNCFDFADKKLVYGYGLAF